MTKSIIGFLMLILISFTSYSQNFKINFKNSPENKIVLVASNGSIKINGYDGNEVRIKAKNVEKDNVPERAKGLKSLYNTAEDNTGLGLSVVQEGNVLKIVKASRHYNDYELEVPKNVAVTLEQVNWNHSDMEMANLNGELEIKSTTGNILLNNVSGPIIANSVSGNLRAEFNNLRQGKPTSISLVSGDIDLTMPADSKADFRLQSISGEIYTDLDIVNNKDREEGNLRQIGGGYTIQGKNNGGGTELSLNTISGNIYIRKK